MNRFKSKVETKNVRHIIDPNGEAVLIYARTTFGRLGNLSEYCLWTIDEDGRYGEPLIACHGGYLRHLLRYLNYDNGEVSHDLKPALTILDALRRSYYEARP